MSRDILLQKIDEVRGRQRSVAIGQGVARIVLALIGLVVAFFLIDWLILAKSTPGSGDRLARGILVAAMLVTLGWVAWSSLIRVLLHTPDDDEVALKVEKGHPELRGRLISTIQLRRSSTAAGSKELIAALESDTVEFVGTKHFTDIIDLALLKKVALWALGVIVLAGALGAWRSDFATAILARLALTETTYPTAAKFLEVTSGTTTARGEPFVITAKLDPTATLPEKASATIRDAEGRTSELPLLRESPGSATYVGTIDQVLGDLEFRPSAHDALWPVYEKIIAVDRPAIKALSLAYRFPDYLNKKAETSSVGDIRAPEGSRVTITAQFNRPVVSAKLVARNDQKEETPLDLMLVDGGGSAAIDLPVLTDGSWRLLLRTADGFDNKNPIDYVIDAVADRAPTAKIAFPAQDKTVTRFARWPIRFTSRDDHGIAKGRLKYVISTADEATASTGAGSGAFTVDTQPANAQSLELAGLVQGQPRPEAGGEVVFDLRQLGLTGDCRITYWIEVEDSKTPTPNRGISPTYVFTVVDAKVLEEMLERDRTTLIDSLKTIRTKQKDGRDGVDTLRRELQDTPAPAPTPAPK